MTRCEFCGCEIDPDVCWCGDPLDGVTRHEHCAVPMGCMCAAGVFADDDAFVERMTEREKLEATLETLKTQDFCQENSDTFYCTSGRKAEMTRRILAVKAHIKELDNE